MSNANRNHNVADAQPGHGECNGVTFELCNSDRVANSYDDLYGRSIAGQSFRSMAKQVVE